MAKISINLSKNETKLKDLIKDLSETKTDGNPYFKRSESEIAKMILEPALSEEHKKYIKKTK